MITGNDLLQNGWPVGHIIGLLSVVFRRGAFKPVVDPRSCHFSLVG